MLPIWGYLTAAYAIALTGFGIGQLAPGMGIVFLALVSTVWTAWSVRCSCPPPDRRGRA